MKTSPLQNIPVLNKLKLKHFIILAVAIILAMAAFFIVRQAVKSMPFEIAGTKPIFTSTQAAGGDSTGLPTPEIIAPDTNLPSAWDGASRVNILVMGLDYADWEADRSGPSRSDSMMLVSIDPATKTGVFLSVPRDLWVNIPGGYGYGKINTAHAIGEGNKLPGGGPALAAKTVSEFLGVPIQYYAVISFDAFTNMIDELGCINIWAYEEFDIDPIGPGNTVHLTKDKGYCMDGATLLAYARARHTEGGDVDRAKRQQQVLLAVRDYVLDPANFPGLVAKAPVLYEKLASGVKTNMSLDDALKLARLAQDVTADRISQKVIDYTMVTLAKATASDGTEMSIFLPIPDKIRELRDSLFATESSQGPMATGDMVELMKEEGATVAVLNGTYTAGLAATTADYLKSQGVNVVEIGNPEQVGYARTKIIDQRGKPYMTKYLFDLFGVDSEGQFAINYDPNSTADVVIIVGDDWVYNNPMP